MNKKFLLIGLFLLCVTAIFTGISTVTQHKTLAQSVAAIQLNDGIEDQEQELLDIVYDTWKTDGSPKQIPEEGVNQTFHYCIRSMTFMNRSDRLEWVIDAMGGMSNPNHVHHIQFGTNNECEPGGICWHAEVWTWTESQC